MKKALDNLRAICAEKEITLTKACELSGVPWGTVMDWNENKPNATNLLKMASALDIDPIRLIEGVDDGQP